jgi:hypothetical protein
VGREFTVNFTGFQLTNRREVVVLACCTIKSRRKSMEQWFFSKPSRFTGVNAPLSMSGGRLKTAGPHA